MHLQEILNLTKVTWSIALYIMWPMYLQSLNLLWPMVKMMHYQENTLTFNRRSRSHKMLPSTLNIMWTMHQQSLMLLHPMVKRRCIYKKIHYLTLTQGHTMWPMHLRSLKLLRQMFRRRYIYKKIQHHEYVIITKCCPVPSTSCALFSYKVWSCYV